MALPMERQERIVALLEERDALLTQQISDQLNISLNASIHWWFA
jgi:DeoR/GlpR family transcriptional regulator of sugar metabolism